jgi:hypothetical protein
VKAQCVYRIATRDSRQCGGAPRWQEG